MLELPMRLVIAYGLIALLVLGAVALIMWRAHNTPRRRDARTRQRLAELYRRRDAAAAAAAAPDR